VPHRPALGTVPPRSTPGGFYSSKKFDKCDRSLERYDSISAASQPIGPVLVHPLGHPINHSTNIGFNRRREVGVVFEDGSPCVVVGGSWRERAHVSSDGVPALGLSWGTSPSF
jgi:hypothetical protein